MKLEYDKHERNAEERNAVRVYTAATPQNAPAAPQNPKKQRRARVMRRENAAEKEAGRSKSAAASASAQSEREANRAATHLRPGPAPCRHTGPWRQKRLRAAAQTLVLALALAAYACVLPVYSGRSGAGEEVYSSQITYQAMTRDQTRSMAVETLADLATDPTATDEQRHDAQDRLNQLLEQAQKEARIEEELLARGFGQSVASVSESFVSVLLENQPDATAVAAILEAAERISGCASSDIRLIPLNIP